MTRNPDNLGRVDVGAARGNVALSTIALVIAAAAALAAGAGDVLILDLDAHCGGGTHAITSDNPHVWHVDVSVNRCDLYEPGERTSLDLVADG